MIMMHGGNLKLGFTFFSTYLFEHPVRYTKRHCADSIIFPQTIWMLAEYQVLKKSSENNSVLKTR